MRSKSCFRGYVTPENRAKILEDKKEVIDPITMSVLAPDGMWFEIQRPHGAPEAQTHQYVDPRSLWSHMQREDSRGVMANNRQPIWYEDWYLLFYNYGPPPRQPYWQIPSWVDRLPRRIRLFEPLALSLPFATLGAGGAGPSAAVPSASAAPADPPGPRIYTRAFAHQLASLEVMTRRGTTLSSFVIAERIRIRRRMGEAAAALQTAIGRDAAIEYTSLWDAMYAAFMRRYANEIDAVVRAVQAGLTLGVIGFNRPGYMRLRRAVDNAVHLVREDRLPVVAPDLQARFNVYVRSLGDLLRDFERDTRHGVAQTETSLEAELNALDSGLGEIVEARLSSVIGEFRSLLVARMSHATSAAELSRGLLQQISSLRRVGAREGYHPIIATLIEIRRAAVEAAAN